MCANALVSLQILLWFHCTLRNVKQTCAICAQSSFVLNTPRDAKAQRLHKAWTKMLDMKDKYGLSVTVRFNQLSALSDSVRDPTKDQSIVIVYLLCVVGLLIWAFVRSRWGHLLMNNVLNIARRTVRA